MTKKYTPGPWVIYDTGFGISHIRGSNEKENPYYLAQVFTGKLWEKNGEANARLISCAPELLEALEETVAELKSWWKDQGRYGTGGYDEWIPKLDALISKAKGE